MLNKHLFKILAIFTVILGLGFLSFSLISNFSKSQAVQASAGQGR